MPRKELLKNVKRIVIKVGTSTITDNGVLSDTKINHIAENVKTLIEKGYQIVIVSSGAISAASVMLKKNKKTVTIPEKQALAAVGQAHLINKYREIFQKYGYHIGQILLTEDDVKNRRRFLNARNTLETLISMGIVPIVNENDSVVVKEIKFGDNDTLSAHVSSLINADLLILLSDINGFYRDMNDPEPVEELYKITSDIYKSCGESGTELGTGGMLTKIRAAEIIIRFGEKMIIANGSENNVLTRIMDGEKIGTIFVGNDKKLSSRKKWLAVRSHKGEIIIDDGAVDALINRKKSLLPSGIREVKGIFDMGDTVELFNSQNQIIGKGIIKYNHSELDLIKGKNTREIEKIFGSTFYNEAIHRDDLILY